MAVALSHCSIYIPALLQAGIQSALEPAGRGAEEIADLFWWMASAAAIIWLAFIGLSVYIMRTRDYAHPERWSRMLIIGGGAVFPVLALGGLLAVGLPLTSHLVAPAPEGSLHIEVSGEQWWWRVRYPGPDGKPVELANEIRLPVDEPVQFRLTSLDVIHSFWIPPLAGKMDMIPGRVTQLAVQASRTGTFRGACAEYCGGAHALMNFPVVVMARPAFDEWLRRQAEPARTPSDAAGARGFQVFLSEGCGACHTVRGTDAAGTVGPDLTHVGSRLSLGAGTLPNEPADFRRWIENTEKIKPEVHMPAFGMLKPEDLRALAAYLDGLE